MVTAKIDDVVTLGSSRVEWKQTAGTAPVMADFDVTANGLERLLVAGGPEVPHTLTIEEGGNRHVFEKLYVVRIRPGENPNLKRVVLADCRWFFKYKHVKKVYNLRRRTGSRRRGQWQEELQPQPVFKYLYAPFSMFDEEGETPWAAADVLFDVLIDPEALNIDPDNVVIDPEVDQLRNLPIESLLIDDAGDDALSIALSKIPGTQVTVENDGKVRIFSVLSRQARLVTGEGKIGEPGAAGHEIVGAGHVEFDDRRFLRARAVDVLFTMESELRFDFFGDNPSSVGTVTEKDPPLFCENVLPVPDFELTLTSGEKVYQGTWITIWQAVTAWRDKLPQGLLSSFTFDTINKAFIPGTGYWAALDLLGKLNATGQDADWSARIGALQTHYRQTYRIARQWRDKVISWRNFLVATIDVTSGQRAPSMAFSDHAFIPSKKALLRRSLAGEDLFYGINQSSYPGVDTEITAQTKPSPANVQILDSDQGIVRLNYQLDPYRLKDMILPSKITNMPAKDFRRSNVDTPFGFDMASLSEKIPQLSPNQQAAILVSAVPGAPNSKAQFYRIQITPGQVARLLPQAAGAELALAKGPIKEIRVGAGIETARIRWKNADRDKIKKIFGVPTALIDPRRELADLVINDDEQADIGDRAASLPNIALAVAASYYAGEHARVAGGMTTRMNTGIRLEGSMRELVHGLDRDGMAMTAINLPPEIDSLAMYAFMDSNTRQIVQKNVQPFD